jgi:hypothetical protein
MEKIVKLKRRAPAKSSAMLAPGIHPARIEVRAGDRYHVRTLAGERVEARLAADMDEAFADECLRGKRTVLATPGEGGMALILGALQTSCTVSRDREDAVRARGKRLELHADEGIVLRVGKTALVMDQHGTVTIVGQKMTVNVAEAARILSTLCELP